MEHSALHAIQLTGLVTALGGAFFVLGLLRPACRSLGANADRDRFSAALAHSASLWVFRGAAAAALAASADLFVQVGEISGQTLLAGVDLSRVGQFVTKTVVGRVCLARIVLLLLTAAVARSSSRHRWWPILILACSAAVLTGLVSHAAAQPTGRAAAIGFHLAHLFAAAGWMGVLIHLLAARPLIEAGTARECVALTAEVARRFSPWALMFVSLLMVSGLIAAYRFLGEPSAALTSAYGLTLLVKLTLLAGALYAGYLNFQINRPALRTAAGNPGVTNSGCITPEPPDMTPGTLRRFGRALELEATCGILVIMVAGVVGSVSPPGEAGAQRLSAAQTRALLSPDLPTTTITNPAKFYGASERTLDDLRYSEFTHNWSGLAVCVLGLCWLAQRSNGPWASRAARFWPFLLVAFGIFVGFASDPEIWVMRRISLWEAVRDPQLLEHQLGAVILFLLAWLGWRDRHRARATRPLGYPLPCIMILGSFLLLGHAHSTLTVTEEFTNLINVQHAVLGALGLFAGTVRWLELRALLPARLAGWLWPSLVAALGILMAFFYREVT